MSHQQRRSPLQLNINLENKIISSLKNKKQISFPNEIQDFKFLVQSGDIFVDKTLFIKQIIDLKKKVAFLILRPRKWGKTLTMTMLKYFFKIQVNKKGEKIQPQPNKVLFEGQNIIQNGVLIKKLQPLLIAKDPQWNTKYLGFQGNHPVIFMSWKDIKYSTYLQFYNKFKYEIGILFQQYEYLYKAICNQKSDNFDEKNSKIFKSIRNQQYQIQSSLLFLSRLLYKFHDQKRVILLIDEYDTPFNYILGLQLQQKDPIKKKNLSNERKLILDFCIRILSCVVKPTRQIFQKCVLTGNFDILKKQANSSINNVIVCNIKDIKFSTVFGFSKDQIQSQLVNKMFKKYSKQIFQYLLNNITQWYNGYQTKIQDDLYIKTYNPFAVIQYLNQCIQSRSVCQCQNYWNQSGSDNYIKLFIQSQKQKKQIGKVLKLNQINPVKMAYTDQISLVNINFTNNIQQQYLTYLLLHSGYITGRIRNSQIVAIIPNKQIFNTFRNTFQKWAIQQKLFFNLTHMDLENSKDLFQKMQQTINYIKDSLGELNQKIFNSLFAIRYILSKDKKHSVSAELYSGSGIIDNIFYPNKQIVKKSNNKQQVNQTCSTNSKSVIIHQYKYLSQIQKQQAFYNDALWQIYLKNYLKHPIQESKTSDNIQKIIIRPIIILSSKPTNQIKIYNQNEIIHTIKQAKIISKYFSSPPIIQIINSNTNKEILRNNILAKLNASSLKELLIKIVQNSENDQQNREEQLIQDYLQIIRNQEEQTNKETIKIIKNQIQQLSLNKPPILQLNYENLDYQQVINELSFSFSNNYNNRDFLKNRLMLKFKNAKELYYATLNQIEQIQGIKNQAFQQFYNSLQQMKKKQFYYSSFKNYFQKKKEEYI